MTTPAENVVYAIIRTGALPLQIAEIAIEIDTPLFAELPSNTRLLTDLPILPEDVFTTLDDAILARRRLVRAEIARWENALSTFPILRANGLTEVYEDVFFTIGEVSDVPEVGGCGCCCGDLHHGINHDDIDALLGFSSQRRDGDQEGC